MNYQSSDLIKKMHKAERRLLKEIKAEQIIHPIHEYDDERIAKLVTEMHKAQ